ncbi:homocysteine S-methyltransferase YbgG-like [Diadema setosum]|uniref:homocysteine S-methyltransferase YbgG-like n=1 Tax=Diadema setosum TaxID=31175 RepID=UPI003B3BA75D
MKVIDGGLSTELERIGYPLDWDDPLWTSRSLLTDPGTLKKAHLSFLEHGADIILTATYQVSKDLLEQEAHMGEEDFHKLMKLACQVAREAADEFWEQNSDKERSKPMIAGSVGPYGACLHDFSEYHGRYVDGMTKETLMNWHRPRVRALVEGGVDLVAIETIPSIQEASALLTLLEEFPNAKAWMSFSCKDKTHIGHGETLAEAATLASKHSQIMAVGANCLPAENVTSLLQSVSACGLEKPLIVYPNSPGDQWTGDAKNLCGKATVYELDTLVPEWIEAGARYIGGCCGMAAPDIGHLSKIIQSHSR